MYELWIYESNIFRIVWVWCQRCMLYSLQPVLINQCCSGVNNPNWWVVMTNYVCMEWSVWMNQSMSLKFNIIDCHIYSKCHECLWEAIKRFIIIHHIAIMNEKPRIRLFNPLIVCQHVRLSICLFSGNGWNSLIIAHLMFVCIR